MISKRDKPSLLWVLLMCTFSLTSIASKCNHISKYCVSGKVAESEHLKIFVLCTVCNETSIPWSVHCYEFVYYSILLYMVRLILYCRSKEHSLSVLSVPCTGYFDSVCFCYFRCTLFSEEWCWEEGSFNIH